MLITDLLYTTSIIFCYCLFKCSLFPEKLLGNLIHYNFVRLGPLGIKIGQILSHRVDFIPEDICKILSKLTCHINSAEDEDDNVEFLKKFTNYKMIGSGCIANSYLIEIDNRKLVAKVKRNNIKRKILDSVNRIHNLISFMNSMNLLPFAEEMIKKLEGIFNILIRQADFDNELSEMHYFYDKYKDSDKIIVPRPYRELSNDNVIVMDYLDGKDIGVLSKDEKYKYALDLWNFAFESTFVEGHWHSDLHKGNLVFHDEKLGIIDYGITGKFSILEKTIILNYNTFLAKKQFDAAARLYVTQMTKMLKPSSKFDRFNKSLFIHDVSLILSEYFDINDGCPDIFGSVKSLSGVSRKYGALFNDRFVEFELAFSTLLSVLSELGDKSTYEYLVSSCIGKQVNTA